jgi:hypothetical protein
MITSEEFVVWLKDFVDKSPNKTFTKKELSIIKNKMKEVKEVEIKHGTNLILSC